MKRIISLILMIFMVLSLFVGCNDTADEAEKTTVSTTIPTEKATGNIGDVETPVESFLYEENEDGGITITGYTGTLTIVVIPSKIQDKLVTRIGHNSFREIKTLESVKIPDTVIQIEAQAFYQCSNILTVQLPKNLLSIGAAAFQECKSLKNITIPSNVNKIDDYAFYASGVETVTFEEGIEIIGDVAFGSTKIKNLVLPKSVKTIQFQAFGDCLELECVKLNEGLVTIEDGAFAMDTKLTEIIIPKTVNNITEMAFNYCNQLKKVKFDGDAPSKYNTSIPSREVSYTIYYHDGASGFTSPEWCGYPTQIW